MFNLITILGPTATGKTALASGLAALIGGEIISADSRQVYRGMDLGTGKDLKDFVVDGKPIPYHLIDIVDPGYEYNVFEFQQDFLKALNVISERGNQPILCGGSGMYLDAILRNYKLDKVPENRKLRAELLEVSDDFLVQKLRSYGPIHNISDTDSQDRLIRAIEIREFEKKYPDLKGGLPEISFINFGIRFEREIIRQRITERLKNRLEEGMIEEVKRLLGSGLKPEQLTFYGLEYKYLTLYVIGEISYDEMFSKLNTAIHQFAKRQMTWFRRMEKKGVKIHWIDGENSLEEKLAVIGGMLPEWE
ncbi:MAG: tRNA (adenosine(37)-N6)-dimethylallyltransferase MiaA [Bacteroidetes bacterium]|nr:MAG: tRNA (adenosine(37)-N6)-dimethylallyltransferase MiaA [Bacteroidota bacterium]